MLTKLEWLALNRHGTVVHVRQALSDRTLCGHLIGPDHHPDAEGELRPCENCTKIRSRMED